MSISRITANASAKSVLNDRLALLDNGFTPLRASGKAVRLKDWPTLEINEIDVRRWSKDDDLAAHTNTGLRMGNGLVALDLDIVDAAMARLTGKKAEDLAPNLPPRRIGKAPKALLLFRIDGKDFETFKSTTYLDKEGRQNKIEILATGSQFIAFGIHPDTGKPYQWEDDHSPLTIHRDDLPKVTEADLRQFVMECEMAFEEAGWTPAPTYTRDGVFDRDAALDAIESGADLHDSSRDLAAHFAAIGWHRDDAEKEIRAAFERCEVKDSRWRARLRDLPRMLKTAYRKYGDHDLFDDDDEEGSESRKPVKRDPRAELNRRHAVITVGGKTKIATFTAEGVALGEEKDLRLRYSNRFAPADPRAVDRAELIGGNPPPRQPLADAWLKWPNRREYHGGIDFRPDGKTPRGTYNLWQGWAVEPDPEADCDLFLDHLHDVVCRGNRDQSQWVLGWLAHLVQRPAEKPRSAIVLRGEKGAGKDITAQYVARLMHSSAYLNTSDQDAVIGDFNGAVANKLFLHLEEAFFSGDHRADSRIKNLITAPSQTINEKHAPRYSVSSFHRLWITSNSFRAVNATSGERRYFISEVSDARCGDREYFDALVAEMNGDGPAALMHKLRRYDLTKWNPRPPATEALRDHIASSLTGVTAWISDCIAAGALIGLEHEIAWPEEAIEADQLRRIFEGWSRKPANRYRGIDVTESAFGKGLAPFRTSRKLAGPRDDRRYFYTLLSLEDARDELDVIINKGN